MNRLSIFSVLAALLCLTCAQRDGELADRTNPFDPGGDDYRYGQPPAFNMENDSIAPWVSYDSASGRGTVRISFWPWDPDEQSIVSCSLYASRDSLQVYSPLGLRAADSSLLVPSVAPGETLYYVLTARDGNNTTGRTSGMVVAPRSAPPRPLTAIGATSTGSAIHLTWVDNGASSYGIFRSTQMNGVYVPVGSATSSPYTDYPPTDGLYYYMVAATNEYGGNLSRDTAWAQRWSTDVSGPTSATAYSYGDYLNVDWWYSSYTIVVFRSTDSLGAYSPIDTVSYTGEYNDTVPTTSRYFYRVCALSMGKQSELTPPTTGVRIDGGNGPASAWAHDAWYRDSIVVYWTCMDSASMYRICRWRPWPASPDSAIHDSIHVTDSCRFVDVVGSDTTAFYYSVAGYDSRGIGRMTVIGDPVSILKPPTQVRQDTSYTEDSVIAVSFHAPIKGTCRLYRSSDSIAFILADSVDAYYSYGSTYRAYDTIHAASASQRHYYRVTMVNDSSRQESRPSSAIRCWTKPGSLSSPVEVAFFSDRAELTWGNSTGAQGYRVYRYITNAYSHTYYRLVATISDSLTTWYTATDSLDTVLYYRVVAYNQAGESNWYAGSSVAVHALRAPTEHVYVESDGGNGAGILLWWDPISQAENYLIYRAPGNVPDPYQTAYYVLFDSTTDTFYLDSPASDSLYYYRVKAKNRIGRGPLDQTTHYTSGQWQVPDEPDSTLASKGKFANAVRVQWTRPLGADTFAVYRGSANDAPSMTRLGTTTDTVFVDPVWNDSAYYYLVRSINELGQSNQEYYASFAAQGFRAPSALPDTVTGLAATTTYFDRIVVTWDALDSWDWNFTGFYVYRSSQQTGPWTPIDTVEANLTAGHDYTATAPLCPDRAWFTVVKYNTMGAGPMPAAVQGCKQP